MSAKKYSNHIIPWEKRIRDDPFKYLKVEAMQAEIADLRAALAAGVDAAPAVDVCAEMRAMCSACGGTGDVTTITGEWRGSCDCEASAWSREPVASSQSTARLDPVVKANRALLHQRSQIGIKKYGTTLDEARLPERQILQHALEEALDLANYLQARIMSVAPVASADECAPCKGMNCGCTDFISHSAECQAEHAATVAGGASFQSRVQPWMMECFGSMIASDMIERNHRFLEEALELVQACGATADEAHQLVDYTFGRSVGEKSQEVGGVMVTLAALIAEHETIVCAWGANAKPDRVAQVRRMFHRRSRPMCLGVTKDGAPRHPLYIHADQPLVDWRAA